MTVVRTILYFFLVQPLLVFRKFGMPLQTHANVSAGFLAFHLEPEGITPHYFTDEHQIRTTPAATCLPSTVLRLPL
jgi:hypothetical protein